MGWKRRHGLTKMVTFRFRGKQLGDLGYKSKSYGTHEACPHSRWTWQRHIGSKIQTNIKQSRNNTSQQVLGRTDHFLLGTKTKMTALVRSIDLRSGWTNVC